MAAKGQADDKQLISQIVGISKEEAIFMIREKIESRLEVRSRQWLAVTASQRARS